jgi:hypothetical protein
MSDRELGKRPNGEKIVEPDIIDSQIGPNVVETFPGEEQEEYCHSEDRKPAGKVAIERQ